MAIGKSFNLKKQKVTQKLGKIFGLFKEISCIVIIWNRQVQLYVPRKESYPTPLSNIDVISSTYADLETAQRSEFMTIGISIWTEICQIRERVSTIFTLLSEIPQKGNNQSERRLTKIQTTSRPDCIWLDGRTRNGKVIGKLLFHEKDRIPEHACGKLLFQNDKSQSVWSKEKCSCIDIAGAWRNSVLYYNLVHEFVPMKRSDESSSPNFLFLRWKQSHVVSFRDTAFLWDKILRVTLKIWGVRDTLKCGPVKKDVSTSDIVLLSESRVYTQTNRVSRMVRTILEICLSETFASENREYVQKIFHSKQCWFQTQRQQWTRNERTSKRGTQNNNKESPLCCTDGHPPIQKYMYILVNVRKSNLKWGNNFVLDEFVHEQRFFTVKKSRTDEKLATEFPCAFFEKWAELWKRR